MSGSPSLSDIYNAPGAKRFLDSKSRSSQDTKKGYGIGLTHFQRFLNTYTNNDKYTLETIIKPLSTNEIDVYKLLDDFVSFLIPLKLQNKSIKLYVTGVRAYLGYYGVYVIPIIFKQRVTLPKIATEDAEALDAADVRKILLSCNNRRLKAYILVLASGGVRASEALAIRLKDIHFEVNPTVIKIRKEYAKTRKARDAYISNEATEYLTQWINFKYRNKKRNIEKLVFAVYEGSQQTPYTIYVKIRTEFNKVLDIAGYGERKEGMKRRKITLHSLRKLVKTVSADNVNTDFSEFLIGHAKSSYYEKKEPANREIYATKVMRHLTFLDYTALEERGKGIESDLKKLQEQMKRVEDIMSDESAYSAHLESEITEMKKELDKDKR